MKMRTIAILAVAAMTVATSHATTLWTGTGNWTNAANWSGGVPSLASGDPIARFTDDNSVTTVSTAVDEISKVQLGHASVGSTLNVETGGSVTINNIDMASSVAGDTGFLNINGGSVTSVRLDIGEDGYGEINLNSGSLNTYTLVDNFSLGHTASGSGVLNVNGGTFDTRELISGTAGTGAFNLSGGVATVDEKLIVGRDGNGTVTVTGGELTVGTLLLNNNAGNASVVTLTAGITHVDQITIGVNGTLNLAAAATLDTYTNMAFSANGLLVWEGDQTVAVSDMVGDGTLTWSGATATYDDARAFDQEFLAGGEYLRSSYDGTNTEVWTVIPEPATLGMVVVMGGGMLFIRRRMM